MGKRTIGIQYKIIGLTLGASLLALVVTHWYVYDITRETYIHSAFAHLTAIRESKAEQITRYVEKLEESAVALSENRTVIEAMTAFPLAITAYQEQSVSDTLLANAEQSLRLHYQQRVLPNIEGLAQKTIPLAAVFPHDHISVLLQSYYLLGPDSPGQSQRERLLTPYRAAHGTHHSHLTKLKDRSGFYDLMLIDGDTGRVVYSNAKEIDFGTNLVTGPFKESHLAGIFRAVRTQSDTTAADWVDFQHYLPSGNAPAAFVGTPIFDHQKNIGVLVVQVPIEEIDNTMTFDRQWQREGMGETGECYLVGPDSTLRSNTRDYLERVEAYRNLLQGQGTDPNTLRMIDAHGTTVKLQRVNTEATQKIAQGLSGTGIITDSHGVRVLSSYKPLALKHTSWGLVAEIDEAEILAPIMHVRHRIFYVIPMFLVVVVLLSLLLARRIVLPVGRLTQATRRLQAGERVERIPVEAHDEIGELGHAFNAMVGQLQQSRSELADAEARSRKLLESAGEGIFGVDSAGTVVFANPAAAIMLRYTVDELIGQNIHNLVHHSHADGSPYPVSECPMARSCTEGQAFRIEDEVLWRRDGKSFPVEYVSTPLEKGGRLTGAVVTFTDITQRRKAALDLVEAREAAEAANHAKSDFLSNMSHELRTPLNGVLGYVQILLRDRQLSIAQKQSLAAIQTCGEQLLVLINDILDLAKIERGKLEYHYEPTDLAKLITDVHDIIVHHARDKGLALACDIAPEVPPGINSDPSKLRQILLNLAGNAVKFTQAGHIRLQVGEPHPGTLRFAVEDTGAGISRDKLEEIFDPFKQAEAGHSAGGTGLGLAISRRLVEGLKGKLGVKSQKGQGSTFWFEIPYEEVRLAQLSQAEAETTRANSDPVLAPGQDITVLIADDRATNREILAGLMQHIGFKTDLAENGQEALDKMRQNNYPLVLMDVRMPVLDGLEAVKQIREDMSLKETIVIAVSTSVFADFRERIKSAGFDGFLSKPLQAAELFQLLRSLTPFEFVETERPVVNDVKASAEPDKALSGDVAQTIAETLLKSIDMGDVGAINALAEQLLTDESLPSSLGKQMQELAMAFDFTALKAIADRLKQTGDSTRDS
ncbi:ATP-binding protein [Planctomycetota bacterium]